MPGCAFWPYATPAPAFQNAPFPSVPTLILSGAEDLRTPTANAREVAAQIPGSKLLVVPNVGHSVLGDDPTSCSSNALKALFLGASIKPCPASPPPVSLTPLAPARLAGLTPTRGNHGKPGRTLAAVLDTLADVVRQVEVQALGQLNSGHLSGTSSLSVGGLRAGWAALTGARMSLHGYSYVPGVTVSGTIASGKVSLSVGGSAAARGQLTLGSGRTLSGLLEGQPVRGGSSPAAGLASEATLAALRPFPGSLG
jgi:hypothetical protein